MHGNGQKGGDDDSRKGLLGRKARRQTGSQSKGQGRERQAGEGVAGMGVGWGGALPHADGAQHRKETRCAVPENLARGIQEDSLPKAKDCLS